jgi:hypothetical protein
MLGYKVPNSCPRKALSEPLSAGVRSINAEACTTGHLQDLIEDTAFEASSQMGAASIEILQIPQEWLEWCASIFFVQDYPVIDSDQIKIKVDICPGNRAAIVCEFTESWCIPPKKIIAAYLCQAAMQCSRLVR